MCFKGHLAYDYEFCSGIAFWSLKLFGNLLDHAAVCCCFKYMKLSVAIFVAGQAGRGLVEACTRTCSWFCRPHGSNTKPEEAYSKEGQQSSLPCLGSQARVDLAGSMGNIGGRPCSYCCSCSLSLDVFWVSLLRFQLVAALHGNGMFLEQENVHCLLRHYVLQWTCPVWMVQGEDGREARWVSWHI